MANLDFPGTLGGPQLAIIAAAQNLTANWVDLGAELHVAGAKAIGLWVTLDINDSTNARVRLIAKHTSAGAEEYVVPIRTVGASDVAVEDQYHEFNDDADQSMLLSWALDGLVPYVQFQIQAGAVGAAAGQIDAAHVTTAGG
jgi:hypothetical protein